MSFERLAGIYRAFEAIVAGSVMQQARTAFLSHCARSRHAFLVGEGPGRFLVPLLQSFPNLHVTYIDQSPAMIAAARRFATGQGIDLARVDFRAMDVRNWRSHRLDADLVATHFFLDCFPPGELERCIGIIGDNLASTAQWLMSDFRVPERGWQRIRARLLLKMMYSFFQVVTRLEARCLTDPDDHLRKLGFRIRERRLFNFGFIHSDLWCRDFLE